MGKSLRHEPQHSQGYSHMLCWGLDHLCGPLIDLKSPKNSQYAHFFTFNALQLSPLVADPETVFMVRAARPKEHSTQVSSKSVNI